MGRDEGVEGWVGVFEGEEVGVGEVGWEEEEEFGGEEEEGGGGGGFGGHFWLDLGCEGGGVGNVWVYIDGLVAACLYVLVRTLCA